jgi:hypothetical protein
MEQASAKTFTKEPANNPMNLSCTPSTGAAQDGTVQYAVVFTMEGTPQPPGAGWVQYPTSGATYTVEFTDEHGNSHHYSNVSGAQVGIFHNP